MTDRMTVPTANMGFSTTTNSKKLIPDDCDNDLQPEMATGNGNVATKTGNTYISGTMTDRVTIITQIWVFWPRPAGRNMQGDWDNDRQPEIIMWPSKPKILIYPELWDIGWQFQRQIRGLRPHPGRRSWPRAIATTTDNQKWQYTPFAVTHAFTNMHKIWRVKRTNTEL